MLLSELLQKLGKPEVLNYCDCDIKNVYCDSRECTSDSVFFALKGSRSSVESNVNDAVENGASAVFFDEEDLHISLNYKNTIKIKKSSKTARFIDVDKRDFYNKLLEKMNRWGTTC